MRITGCSGENDNQMEEATPHLTKYVEAFKEHLSHVDELAQVVLKGHLLIESALNNIIETIFFHPEHILERRFQCHQKLAICRALCLRKDKERTWDLIEAINTLRNDVAHDLEGKKRKGRMDRLRQIYVEEGYPTKLKDKEIDELTLVAYACAACSGFLGTFEHDIKALRGYMNALDNLLQSAGEAKSGS
jgi:hypothetical protein